MSSRTRVIAVGSPHGDDQIAWHCAEVLRRELSTIVDFVIVAEPIRLLDHVAECQRLFIIDSCVTGAPVGSIVRFRWPDDRLRRDPGSSTHGFGVDAALDLANALKSLPPCVIVLGIEITNPRTTPQLSSAMERLLPGIVEQIRQEIERPLGGGG